MEFPKIFGRKQAPEAPIEQPAAPEAQASEARGLALQTVDEIFMASVTDGPIAGRIREIIGSVELKDGASLTQMLYAIASAVSHDPTEMLSHERDRRMMFAGELIKKAP